jgi:hypothetical protein
MALQHPKPGEIVHLRPLGSALKNTAQQDFRETRGEERECQVCCVLGMPPRSRCPSETFAQLRCDSWCLLKKSIHHMNTSGGQAGRTEMKVVRLESGGGPAVRQ